MDNTNTKSDTIPFELTYSALKMFGKQLYTNVGSAISELVANGIDAKAKEIYISINVTDRHHAIVEILDTGKGMTKKDFKDSYILIGRNKREKSNDSFQLGRKGVGKLAALYLSDCFYISSKTSKEDMTTWKLDVSDVPDNKSPSLESVSNNFPNDMVCLEKWNNCDSGTYIYLRNVDFNRFGNRSFESLESKLSNFYLYENLNTHIYINIFDNSENKGDFRPVKKRIAYKNMVCIYTSDEDAFEELKTNTYKLPFEDKLKNQREYTGTTEVIPLVKILGDEISGEYQNVPYEIKGWVGIHSSIDKETAEKNDDRYLKNQYYNPNQLRVYVRNKLGMSNMIEYLGIPRAFANYIEGEVVFDVLDDDNLEDIASAGRQGFDTHDERFIILQQAMSKVGNALVSKRQSVADKIKVQKKLRDTEISSSAKNIFTKEIHDEIDAIEKFDSKAKTELERSIVSKIEGDTDTNNSNEDDVATLKANPKTKYTVFISHASKDNYISDCIYNYLKSLGFNGDLSDPNCEIFYSSSGMDSDNMEPLSKVIKKAIISHNNDILFLTSKNFMNSPFCLFEGGAAWATRAINEYKILSTEYKNIPTFLTNGKSEICLNIKDEKDFQLNGIKYNDLVVIVNRLIQQLNKNRIVSGEKEAPLLKKIDFPDKVQLKHEKKTEQDYMDEKFLEYWQTYVIPNCCNYFEESQLN